ncbi:hypothetical protein Ancab_025977 [Ancistrocladus abbreviatus]
MVFTESNGSSSSETDDISLILRHLLNRSSSSSSPSLPSSSTPSMLTPAAGEQNPLSFLSSSSSPPSSNGVTGIVLPDNFRRFPCQPAIFSGSDRLVVDRISAAEPSAGLNTSSGIVLSYSSCFPEIGGGGSAVSSSLVGPVESESTVTGSVQLRNFYNDTAEEYDCESEEGPGAAVEEAQPKQPPCNPSKRGRAAEVHNLSEKRRRSRINEKMKTLQKLIPNSNKTDKASMLDEAIEYLKQLQLQVQQTLEVLMKAGSPNYMFLFDEENKNMLSMRNGLTHPMCLPAVHGVLHSFQLNQVGMDFSDGEGSLHTNLTSPGSLKQESQDPVLTLPNPYASSTSALIGNTSSHNILGMINPEVSFGLESSLPVHLSPFDIPSSSEDICREDNSMPQQQLVGNRPETNSVETWGLKDLKPGAGARMQLPRDIQASYVNEDRSFDVCIYRERTDGFREQSLSCDLQGN